MYLGKPTEKQQFWDSKISYFISSHNIVFSFFRHNTNEDEILSAASSISENKYV